MSAQVDTSRLFIKPNGERRTFYILDGPTYVTDDDGGGFEPQRRQALMRKIDDYGGRIRINMDQAEIWVVNDAVIETYKRYCANVPNHRAVTPGFIAQCRKRGEFVEEYREDKHAMPGRYPGRRVKYTADEEEMLCHWIASKIPEPQAGGRGGVKLYQGLVREGAAFPNGMWGLANAHPWSSWKEHYKKNSERLNLRIDAIVQEKGYTAQSKTAHNQDRRVNGARRAQLLNPQAEEEEEESQDEGEQGEPQQADAAGQEAVDQGDVEEDEEEFAASEGEEDEEEFAASEGEEDEEASKDVARGQKRKRLSDGEASYQPTTPSGQTSPAPAGPSSVSRGARIQPRAVGAASRQRKRQAVEVTSSPPNTQTTLVNRTPAQVARAYSFRSGDAAPVSVVPERAEDEEDEEDEDEGPSGRASTVRAGLRSAVAGSPRVELVDVRHSPSGPGYVGNPPPSPRRAQGGTRASGSRPRQGPNARGSADERRQRIAARAGTSASANEVDEQLQPESEEESAVDSDDQRAGDSLRAENVEMEL